MKLERNCVSLRIENQLRDYNTCFTQSILWNKTLSNSLYSIKFIILQNENKYNLLTIDSIDQQ